MIRITGNPHSGQIPPSIGVPHLGQSILKPPSNIQIQYFQSLIACTDTRLVATTFDANRASSVAATLFLLDLLTLFIDSNLGQYKIGLLFSVNNDLENILNVRSKTIRVELKN